MTSDNQPRCFSHQSLTEFTEQVFRCSGIPRVDASTAAEVLVTSDLRGIDSHGIARLRPYVNAIRSGRINPKPNIAIIRETPSTAQIDGDRGLGLVVGPRANQVAMEKAAACGSGWVAVKNSNHYGIAGYYPLQALRRDLIGFSMTNSSALVTPHLGAERMLGTNPLAVAFPGAEEPPVVIDMASSIVAYGKIEIAMRENRQIEPGWAIDSEGNATRDPHAVRDGGALLPIGSDRSSGGHKGYCLSSLVDLLSGVLSGANWGPFVPPFILAVTQAGQPVGDGLGHFFGALQIAGFSDVDAFKKRVDQWIRTMRATPPAPGESAVLIPGDPERDAESHRSVHGIPLLPTVAADLEIAADLAGVQFPDPIPQ